MNNPSLNTPVRQRRLSTLVSFTFLALSADAIDKVKQISTYPEWLAKADERIKAGQSASVVRELKSTSLNKIPREHVATVSKLAIRVGANHWALRLLNTIIRSPLPLKIPASSDEIALYAMLLGRLGAYAEGQQLLANLSVQNIPEVDLYRAHLEVFQWNYHHATAHYHKYLKHPDVSGQKKVVAKLNLGACYVYTNQYGKAENILQDVYGYARERNYTLLCGNALELLSRLELNRNNFAPCQSLVKEGRQFLSKANPRYQLYLDATELFCQASEMSPARRDLSLFKNLSGRAAQIQDWETYRECELYQGLLFANEPILQRVYWGTPFAVFKKRVLRLAPFLTPTHYFNFGSELKSERALNISELRLSRLHHQLLMILCSDFYRPLPIGQIFSHLYQDEHFNPNSSPKRIETLAYNLRKRLEDANLPIELHYYKKQLKISAPKLFSLRLTRKELVAS